MEKQIRDLLGIGKGELLYNDFEQICQEFESQFIDFKSLHDFREVTMDHSKKADLMNRIPKMISEYVSAFSNYSGGILVYGVSDSDRQIENEGISDDLIGGSILEWFSRVTASSTEPPVQSFCVQRIPDPNNTDKYFYQIVIGPSEHAPHQAKDFRYYGRFDDENKPLRDLQIRDIMDRQRLAKPKLEVTFSFQFKPQGDVSLLISVKAMSSNEIVIRDSCLIQRYFKNATEIALPLDHRIQNWVGDENVIKIWQKEPFIYPDDEFSFKKENVKIKSTNEMLQDFVEIKLVSSNGKSIKKLYRIRSRGLGYVALYDESCDPDIFESYLWRPSSEKPSDQNHTFIDYIE